jgi:hypothetical protein
LSAGGPDDDLGTHGGDAHLHAGVAILGELPGEKLVELGEEHTICYELQSQTQTQSRGVRLSEW